LSVGWHTGASSWRGFLQRDGDDVHGMKQGDGRPRGSLQRGASLPSGHPGDDQLAGRRRRRSSRRMASTRGGAPPSAAAEARPHPSLRLNGAAPSSAGTPRPQHCVAAMANGWLSRWQGPPAWPPVTSRSCDLSSISGCLRGANGINRFLNIEDRDGERRATLASHCRTAPPVARKSCSTFESRWDGSRKSLRRRCCEEASGRRAAAVLSLFL
jgi:hypothetical protein